MEKMLALNQRILNPEDCNCNRNSKFLSASCRESNIWSQGIF
ncbi:hypothetical protein SLEP1_g11394 [Rubroshorea leprosula]|uniref:Uncharacterized protein n=1 Tax=Rubroshorea leprosula TaxID=152421 RepID=A0AAV5IKE5_9ROSI|nr:hypothetical protein SLEP1_g11394 [Rubroshorea leprosula]